MLVKPQQHQTSGATMRKASLILLAITLASTLQARSRHQSYFTYEDGGTVVVQAEETVEARVNLPVFPGDQIETSRRGRAEIRLADGNVIGLDRGTTMRLRSILDSYDGDASQTVAELDFGLAIVHRLAEDSSAMRLDTTNGSYVSSRDAIYSVETDGRGRDVVSVYEGSMEVRTSSKTSRLRAGDQAKVDEDGAFGINELVEDSETEFERWFMSRADRYRDPSSKYLDRRLAYARPELDGYGSWVYANDYSTYVWRPRVSSGWQPYRDGRWVSSPYGGLVWVSYEPWGWVPYHYGRWAWNTGYGWVWLPGSGYSPAWVYWAFGPSYVGWAPAGWYDCYSSYYDWAYRPYRRIGFDVGFGFHGRIRLSGADLTPWTFVSSNQLMSTRVDRAALTTDAIRGRISRDGDQATVTNSARFTRNELRDPASAVAIVSRRGIGGGTGREGSGPTADLTPFFRRDPELSSSLRDRLVRGSGTGERGSAGTPGEESTGRIVRGESSAGEGTAPPRVSGRDTASEGSPGGRTTIPREGAVQRGRPAERSPVDSSSDDPPQPTIRRESPSKPRSDIAPREPQEDGQSTSRSRVRRNGNEESNRSDDRWRGGTRGRTSEPPATASPGNSTERTAPERSRDVPRRVIDGIGGVRVTPRRETTAPRDSTSSGEARRSRPERTPEPRKVERERPANDRPAKESPPPPPRNQQDASDSGRIKRE